MAEVIKTYRQDVPALRLIGLKYGDGDRVEGMFSHLWGEWFQSGRFGVLERHIGDLGGVYEDGDAYLGMMRMKQGEPFEYWIGVFAPEGTAVPEGFKSVDFGAGSLAAAWVYGTEPDVYMKEGECMEKWKEAGYEAQPDANGALWFFERYGCPRFTSPDGNGKLILDICMYIK